jgi:hypothetical protein
MAATWWKRGGWLRGESYDARVACILLAHDSATRAMGD